MASLSGPPPGLTRPKSSRDTPKTPPSPLSMSFPALPPIATPAPHRPQSASWASSLAAGLFPPNFELPPLAQTPRGIQPQVLPQVPHGIHPLNEAVHPTDRLLQPTQLSDNTVLVNLAVFPAPAPSDPWHLAHSRACAHANQACAACSASLICCSCRSLRFTPGLPPASPPGPPPRRSQSSSPALFRNVGNGTPPPGFDNADYDYDDDAYMVALAEADTCDNSSCPRGTDEPASWTLTVEQFDEDTEEHYDCTFRACGACNRSCKKNLMGQRIKAHAFDNSVRNKANKPDASARENLPESNIRANAPSTRFTGPVPGLAHTHANTL